MNPQTAPTPTPAPECQQCADGYHSAGHGPTCLCCGAPVAMSAAAVCPTCHQAFGSVLQLSAHLDRWSLR